MKDREPPDGGDAVELTVVLPGYNEAEALEDSVAAYLEALPRVGIPDFELVLVDDASTDATGAIADRLAAADPGRIRVLHHPENRGQVAAILNGFGMARGRFVTHNGIDLPFDPGDSLAPLERLRAGADLVVVERLDRTSYGWTRWAMSWVNILLNRVLFRSPFLDHNFVQFYRRDLLARLPVRSRGVSTVTLELIVRAVRGGYRVERETAEYGERRAGRSTITWKKAFHAFRETLRLWSILRGK